MLEPGSVCWYGIHSRSTKRLHNCTSHLVHSAICDHSTCKLFHVPLFTLLHVPYNSVYYNYIIITQQLVSWFWEGKKGVCVGKKVHSGPVDGVWIWPYGKLKTPPHFLRSNAPPFTNLIPLFFSCLFLPSIHIQFVWLPTPWACAFQRMAVINASANNPQSSQLFLDIHNLNLKFVHCFLEQVSKYSLLGLFLSCTVCSQWLPPEFSIWTHLVSGSWGAQQVVSKILKI